MSNETILIEKDAIRELKARYFRLLDTKAWDEWRDVFCDDVTIRVDLTPSARDEEGIPAPLPAGADAFVASIRVRNADTLTVHHGHTSEINITSPETANGIWAMEDIVQPAGSSRVMRGYGHYHEEYRKIDGSWRIYRLYLKRLRVDYVGGPPPSEAEFAAIRGGSVQP